MVHAKKKSGDPDYDDKQPIVNQDERMVTSPDGREVLITESNGPIDRVTGEHVSLEGPTAEDMDNRPAPGEVAKDFSEVQTYKAEDTALGKSGVQAPSMTAAGESGNVTEEAKVSSNAQEGQQEQSRQADSTAPARTARKAK